MLTSFFVEISLRGGFFYINKKKQRGKGGWEDPFIILMS